MERIVDISQDNQHLSIHRGFLLVERDGTEVGRVALDDIAALLVHAHGITYSNSVLVELAARNAPLVACGPNHFPVAWSLPIDGHHDQGGRLRAQWDAPRPLMKRLWRDIVAAKIRAQAALLLSRGERGGEGIRAMAQRVRSGDPENLEAQAARRYWPLLFGEDFRRDRAADGANAMLNYGYTVLRAATARAVVGAGLHPTIGIAHVGRGNAFALVDDLMEPFRPVVDHAVMGLLQDGEQEVSRTVKERLAGVVATDMQLPDCVSPLHVALDRFTLSIARAFENADGKLDFARPIFGPRQLGFGDMEAGT
ncbi:type II CRISPR-associated endonuclease Cas1 [Ferrovibrio sp.]|uniref:type II CRISPR-associated endonuclease Cas1 n=1 Tax=Ferrovibrio sp. TaxID=1917215 RepID=UPI003511C505